MGITIATPFLVKRHILHRRIYVEHDTSIMFASTLTRDIGLRVGPTMFQVLVQHYFDHLKLDVEKSDSLKQDDVLYHEAFTIVKVSIFS